MDKLKIASFFSGCGGMDLGVTGGFTFMGKRFIQNPVEIVFANDIEPDACDIFDANFSHKIIRGDIRKIRSNQIPDHDILMGGFPCQPFSILAQNPPRLGMNDEDGTLFTELIRILKYKKPSCCILENVKGLLHHWKALHVVYSLCIIVLGFLLYIIVDVLHYFLLYVIEGDTHGIAPLYFLPHSIHYLSYGKIEMYSRNY